MAAQCQVEELTKYRISVFVKDFKVTYQITNKQNGASFKIEEDYGAFSIESRLAELTLLLGS